MSGQGCLRTLQRHSDPREPPYRDNNRWPRLPVRNAVQAIITTYKFYCDCVNITSWETYVEPGDVEYAEDMVYDTFQVWRPSSTVDTGCYSLVGENVFTSITFSDGGLVQLSPTPPSNTFITAQSGDVVGYYTNSREGHNEGIQLERNSNYSMNIVWFSNLGRRPVLPLRNKRCRFSRGSVSTGVLRSSTNVAPML